MNPDQKHFCTLEGRVAQWKILLTFFLYPLFLSLLVQLVLLPYVFPNWHAGDGLLKGLDSVNFHEFAVEESQRITSEGWQAWSFTLDDKFVSHFAAIFYALFTPHPWVILPLNALMHALAGWFVYRTLRFLLDKDWPALISALPFLVFPSSLYWVAQMHNDNYAVTGAVALCFGLMSLSRLDTWESKGRVVGAGASCLFGVGLIWLVRKYILEVFLALGGAIFLLLIAVYIARAIQGKWHYSQMFTRIGITIAVFAIVFFFGIKDFPGISDNPSDNPQWATGQYAENRVEMEWKSTNWLPQFANQKIKGLIQVRMQAVKKWGSVDRGNLSMVDEEVLFTESGDIIKYLPRAALIGFLAPFPADWFGMGSEIPNTMMRRISGFEMVFVYLCIPGFLFALWIWRRKPELWVGILICIGMILVYTIATPNIGALYRLRYPYLMLLVGIGVAGWIPLVNQVMSLMHPGANNLVKETK